MYLIWIMVIFMFSYLLRILRGPSLWDRLLGMNLISAKVILVVIALASLYDTSFLLDVSLVCALLSFAAVIFISHFLLERAKKSKAAGSDNETGGE